ncbi:hypothetical protein VYS03_000430 [Klebsiella aerogenes]|nr:hypothetical protein [Klebsiella aerogenes]
MNSNAMNKKQRNESDAAIKQIFDRQTISDAERLQQHQEFINAMNEFTARAGLLSEDPFFEGI